MPLKLVSYDVSSHFQQLLTADIFCKFTLKVTYSLEEIRSMPIKCPIR